MYAAQYSNFHQAKDTYNQITPDRNLRSCSTCTECLAKCAGYINIAAKIDELKHIYV
jgi:succinate dehydrogenase/fumarate reductase-like Fe-S protein